ncbi:MAG: hypothetical protein J6T26_00195 [Firmicutes bacterium]|nr:hypothetical protein [Bacillota bacterium]
MRRQDVTASLLHDVKVYLNITWSDPATDERVRGLIASGTVYLDDKAGGMMDYEADGAARTLLMDYVRYARDEALDVFENNYRSLILALQNKTGVIRYVAETAAAESCGHPAV